MPGATKVFNSTQDPRRDHRHHGGQHRDAEGQPRLRQGAGRRLVRDDGADSRARRDGKAAQARPWPRPPAPTSPASTRSSQRPQMFYTPAEAVAFTKSAELPKTMDFVRKFLFDHGILGTTRRASTSSASSFPDGKTLGDADNVKLRFDPTYMADGGGRKALSGATCWPSDRRTMRAESASRAPSARGRACDFACQPTVSRGGASLLGALPFVPVAIAYLSRRRRGCADNPPTSCCRSPRRWRRPSCSWRSSRTSAPATSSCGPTPRRACAGCSPASASPR